MSLLTTISIQVICAHMNIYRLINIYFKSVIRMLLESDLKESDLMCSIETCSWSFLLYFLWVLLASEGGCLMSDMRTTK